ncbi:hypothetical protein [Urbifossiella limnaea]|uniref:FtsH ternary system domain-containing protein n=1 Tax=Urbifossiella limnaea TaxID=2528023 RepID=A0A517XT51_9BACT|nr:hypothetical protein [Urbifossiella limnaea]QDU20699.1 hypothetical protein ETAA1_26560 [Urbifossiella limnaea]
MTDAPRPLSKFEADLIRLVRFCLGRFPAEDGYKLLRTSHTRPACLSRNAVELVQDSLAKACVLFLVRAGGWRADRHLRSGQPKSGRAWDRTPLDERALTFSPHVVEFLLWATAERVHDTRTPWDAPPADLTAADEFFFWLAFEACRPDPEVAAVLRRKAAFRSNRFAWLGSAADLADEAEPAPPDFAPMFAGERAVMLECLQPLLTQRWLRAERAKGQIDDWRRMRQQGRAEAAGLAAYLGAAESAGRPDLARFVLHANAGLFQNDLLPAFWTSGLGGPGPARLADRLDTQRAAVALPRQMAVLASWQEKYRAVGYFDEGYAASQLWKQDWEAAGGDRVAARARAAVEAIEPLRT